MPATQAALTARNAGWVICEVNAESCNCVDDGLQSSSIQKASGEPEQSPGQNRGGGVIGGGGAAGAMVPRSPSAISRDSASADTAPPSSPHPSASRLPPASASTTLTLQRSPTICF